MEPNEEQLLVTASADNSVAIWDVRKLGKGGKPVSSATHSLTCQSAYFAPDGMQPSCLSDWALLKLVISGLQQELLPTGRP